MRIGIVLHGPEIIDAGGAKNIIEAFREHEVIAKLGGTMGRTAVLDAGLEDMIDISQGLTPSETLNGLKDSIDLAILLNHGKTLETGKHFGRMVASKLVSTLRFVHIESPDCNGRIIYYTPQAKGCAEHVKKILMKRDKNYDLQIEQDDPNPLCIRSEGGVVVRSICGAFPGEHIRLDGIIIGEITGPEPEIVCKEGSIVEFRDGKIKPHGLEKLKSRKIDLFTARVKTGHIRRTKHRRKVKTVPEKPFKTVAIIDHCAESTFELVEDAGIVITVGDDTTSIAADILTRFGVPIIGITDGDLDCILEDTEIPTGSVIIRVREGFDDIVGREVFEKLMKSEQKLHMQNSKELLAGIIALAEKYVVYARYY